MKRKTFFLIFTTDPPAADVVREDAIVEPAPASLTITDKCTFKWQKSKDETIDSEGRVLSKGLRKDMESLMVNEMGEFTDKPSEALESRKKETDKEEKRQKNAAPLQFQEVAERLLVEGAAGLVDKLQPVEKVRKPGLPKNRPAEVRSQIKAELKDMPCFLPGPRKSELLDDSGVYLPYGKLRLARLKFASKPKEFFSELMWLLVPKKYFLMDGVSVSGKRGCEQLPPILIETVVSYVGAAYKKVGGDPDTISIDVVDVVTNMFRNTRRDASETYQAAKAAKAAKAKATKAAKRAAKAAKANNCPNPVNEAAPVNVAAPLNVAPPVNVATPLNLAALVARPAQVVLPVAATVTTTSSLITTSNLFASAMSENDMDVEFPALQNYANIAKPVQEG